MSVADSAQYRTFIEDLARSQSGRLLREELGRRWPETSDHLSSMIRYALLPAGKLIRPIMTLHASEAVGGSPQHALAAALGMEYLHVATLVHDDIIDADELRRGRPAVPVAFGIPDAIVAGDHLIFNAFASIVECRAGVPAGHVAAAVAVLAEAGTDLCRGQVLEAQMAGDLDAGVASYQEMIRLKTGALFRAVCHIGALLGGADPVVAQRLARYGEHVGVAFQIRDDLLAYGPPELDTGKPATSDLTNGRPTLPVLLAYEAGTDAQRSHLVATLNRGTADIADLEQIHVLLDETGGLKRAHEQMTVHANRARGELSTLAPSPGVDVLAGIAYWATSEQP